MKKGVYLGKKKDGTVYYRSSITYKNKHISLGSFETENEAHKAYLEADQVLHDNGFNLFSFSSGRHLLEFKKWVSLLNFRDNGMYIKTPIYLRKHFFNYYFSPDCYYVFDVDDLFYYSTHSIMKKGGHLFVSDYGMQYNILARYGIKNFAIPGKDYLFVNGDPHDFRYHNIEIVNRFHGVTKKIFKGQEVFETKIHVRGEILVGRYSNDIAAAIAYNKAAKILIKKGIPKEFPANFIEELRSHEYRAIYKKIEVSNRISSYPEYKAP